MKIKAIVKNTSVPVGTVLWHCGRQLEYIRTLPSGNWMTNDGIVNQEDEIEIIATII